MDLLEIERRLGEILRKSGGLLPETELKDMISLNDAGEPGVALENFCTQLTEYDVPVPGAVWGELRLLGEAMGLDSSYWDDLAPSTG